MIPAQMGGRPGRDDPGQPGRIWGGGAFLGLAYFDLTYHLMIILVLAAKFSGVLDKVPRGAVQEPGRPLISPAARWNRPASGPLIP
jgi:hypothetical protein